MHQRRMAHGLYQWAETIDRDLPWKATRDPYQIWLSEIILQQTRVEQGRPYWLRFVERFPTVRDLASASQDQVYQVWEGLGYYSRARNLHTSAKYIVEELGGRFPTTYDGLIALKGVGPYTAAAIASFAYNLPHAVVDGNVMRVITRLYGIHTPIDTTAGKAQVQDLVAEALDTDDPARFNQAIMDFGAMQCTPKNPDCDRCPFSSDCQAYLHDLVSTLPIKAKKLKKRRRYFDYHLVIDRQHRCLLHKRPEGDVWEGLYQWPMAECDRHGPSVHPIAWPLPLLQPGAISKVFKQTLSHQIIHGRVALYIVDDVSEYQHADTVVVSIDQLTDYPFPRLVNTAWQELLPVVDILLGE